MSKLDILNQNWIDIVSKNNDLVVHFIRSRIFAKVNAVLPSKLILVGDGPDRYHCERLCRELNLCDHVIFLGKVRDTSHVLEMADVF